jgi:hypothetical protein
MGDYVDDVIGVLAFIGVVPQVLCRTPPHY